MLCDYVMKSILGATHKILGVMPSSLFLGATPGKPTTSSSSTFKFQQTKPLKSISNFSLQSRKPFLLEFKVVNSSSTIKTLVGQKSQSCSASNVLIQHGSVSLNFKLKGCCNRTYQPKANDAIDHDRH